MGTDIHYAIEYFDGQIWRNSEHEQVLERMYGTFAVLGGVRNGEGFAGCDTGDAVEPLSCCRRFPQDVSAEAMENMSNEHSATWFTLSEALAYDWTRTVKERGYVDCRAYYGVAKVRWRGRREEPDGWCGDVDGDNIKKVSVEQMEAHIKGRSYPSIAECSKTCGFYTKWEWPKTYAEMAEQFLIKVLPDMLKLGAKYGHDNVRMVMDFDS